MNAKSMKPWVTDITMLYIKRLFQWIWIVSVVSLYWIFMFHIKMVSLIWVILYWSLSPPLVNLSLFQAITPLLRAVGNICAGEDDYSHQAINKTDLFSSLDAFLHSKHRHIIKETLWVLSNMAGKNGQFVYFKKTSTLLNKIFTILVSLYI